MYNKKSTLKNVLPPPSLSIPRDEAAQKIQLQISKGREFLQLSIFSEDIYEKVKKEWQKWSKYNYELLLRCFDNSVMADEYNAPQVKAIAFDPNLHEKVQDLKIDIEEDNNRLEGILERLDLIPEISNRSAKSIVAKNTKFPVVPSEDVFIVHGHDASAKNEVSRFIEKLGLKAIILHEQPNEGKTIIEKFVSNSDVGFAVVLITPDDIGYTKENPKGKLSRARQNVILELGYFIGKLGRARVCALYKGGVELPSDMLGVLYVPLDVEGGWKMKLAKEIKQAGLEVDFNKAIWS